MRFKIGDKVKWTPQLGVYNSCFDPKRIYTVISTNDDDGIEVSPAPSYPGGWNNWNDINFTLTEPKTPLTYKRAVEILNAKSN